MKKAKYASMLLVLAICILYSACEKEPAASPTEVTYRITPMNAYFTKIAYTDGEGNEVVISDPAEFTDGIKSFFISDKPFTAKFDTEINNTSTSGVSYVLTISVNGKQMKSAAVQVAAGAEIEPISLEFMIP